MPAPDRVTAGDAPGTRDPNALLTTAEFAEWVGVPVRTVRQWITDGTAPRRLRVGRHIRIRWADALSWAESKYIRD